MITFDTQDLHAQLDAMSPAEMDSAQFGIVGMDEGFRVSHYNAWESRMSGLDKSRVLGQSFFLDVAPCMNNFMVAQRMIDEPELDATFDYVLTFRMRPTPISLRLLQSPGSLLRYVIIRRM